MHRHRKAKIVATLGPASQTATPSRAVRGRGRRVPPQLQPRHARGPQARYDIVRALERETGRPIARARRPAGPQAAGRHLRGGAGEAASPARRSVSISTRRRATRTRRHAASRDLRGAEARRRAAARRRQGAPRGRVLRAEIGRDARRRCGGDALRPQGRERGRRRAAGLGADRQGPARPRLRARAGRRLGGAVLRAAAGDIVEVRGAGRQARRHHGEAREAGRDRLPGRDRRTLPTRIMVARGDLGVEMPPEQVPVDPDAASCAPAARRESR